MGRKKPPRRRRGFQWDDRSAPFDPSDARRTGAALGLGLDCEAQSCGKHADVKGAVVRVGELPDLRAPPPSLPTVTARGVVSVWASRSRSHFPPRTRARVACGRLLLRRTSAMVRASTRPSRSVSSAANCAATAGSTAPAPAPHAADAAVADDDGAGAAGVPCVGVGHAAMMKTGQTKKQSAGARESEREREREDRQPDTKSERTAHRAEPGQRTLSRAAGH